MFLVAGLGNPGKEYQGTRHNVGFMAADEIYRRFTFGEFRSKFQAFIADGEIAGEKVLLLKPQTFMNASGDCIQPLCRHYKVDTTSQLIVISDDISMDAGRLRTRKSGSAGGHNGLKSIIARLGSEEFTRIKIGVGDRTHGDLVDHVLGRPKGGELDRIREIQKRAADCAVMIITDGADAAINKYNC